MEDTTTIYVWSEKQRDFVATAAKNVKCPECQATYQQMHWDVVCPGEPFVQCPCGEQFSTINEEV